MTRAIALLLCTVGFFVTVHSELIIQKKQDGNVLHTNVTENVFIKNDDTTSKDVDKDSRIVKSSDKSDDIMTIVRRVCARENIDVRIVKSIIMVESRFFPFAISRVGAMGLMQLMPDTASALGVRNPFDPEENVTGGVRYFKQMLHRFNNNYSLALAAYNAGPEAVKQYNGIPPYRETMEYVKKVLYLYEREGGRVEDPFPYLKVYTDTDGGIVIMDNYSVQHK